jgi:Lipopolysaccharide-assembly
VWLAAAGAALASGCGYSLQGKGITTDASVKRIGVPLFKDLTGKPGLDAHVTQAVMAELLRRGRFDVVKETSGVDALVEGEISAFTVVPINFSSDTGSTQAVRYAITLTASVVYRKLGQAEPLWSNNAFAQRDEYDLGEQSQTYFDQEELAIERLSTAFARSLVAAMLEAF